MMDLIKKIARSVLGTRLYRAPRRFHQSLERFRIRLKYHPRDSGFQDGSKLFFVTGRSKAGTTWMARLLNSHPSLYCSYYEYTPCHQDREFKYAAAYPRTIPAWLEDALAERVWTLLKNGLIASLICECNTLSAQKLGDKSTRQSVSCILEMFPKTQVIVMLRDFRDCAVSQAYMESRFTTWEGYFTDPGMKALDSEFLREYLRNYESHTDFEICSRLASERPEQVIIVRYEDMKSKPEATLRGVFEFLEVTATDSLVKKCLDMNTFEKLSNGRQPGEEDASHFYRKGIIGDWRNHFSVENVAIFKEIAGDTLIAAGYEQDNQWDV
jgi:hypothetical protein